MKKTKIAVAAALIAMIVPAQAQQMSEEEAILLSCKNDLQLSDAGCACVLDKVKTELNEVQTSFFVAQIVGDTEMSLQLQSQLKPEEMMQLAQFMTITPQACSG